MGFRSISMGSVGDDRDSGPAFTVNGGLPGKEQIQRFMGVRQLLTWVINV